MPSKIDMRPLIFMSSVLTAVAGIVLFIRVPSLWFRIYEMSKIPSTLGHNEFTYGGGSVTVTDAPVFPLLLLGFGIIMMFSAYKLERHLKLLISASLCVAITLSLFWLPVSTELLYYQDYGVPIGWLTHSGYFVPDGFYESWGVHGLNFLISVGFWSAVVGTRFLVKKGKSLLYAGYQLGAISYILSFIFYLIQIADSMLWGTFQAFSLLETFFYYISQLTTSSVLLKIVPIFNTTAMDSPLLLGLGISFFVIGFIGVVLTYLALRRIERGVESFRMGVIGGILMIVGSFLLFGFVGGILAILGSVELKEEPKTENL